MLYKLVRPPFSFVNHLRVRSSLIFTSTIDVQSQPTADFVPMLADCRYRLENGTSASLTFPDRRKLGYAQYGLRAGHTVLYLHGYPCSRIEAASLIRISAVDRPGIGCGSPRPNRTILDHAKNVEYLAKQFELCVHSVSGISGVIVRPSVRCRLVCERTQGYIGCLRTLPARHGSQRNVLVKLHRSHAGHSILPRPC